MLRNADRMLRNAREYQSTKTKLHVKKCIVAKTKLHVKKCKKRNGINKMTYFLRTVTPINTTI